MLSIIVMAVLLTWKPNPGPQERYLASTADEVLYGGAAGGGKSDAIVFDALYQVDNPNYRALILRRTFPELERSIIHRSREVYPAFNAKYNDQKKVWRFPSGAIVEMGYLDKDSDVYKYQSAEYQYIAFDELTHFTEFQFDYMRSRLRSGRSDMRCTLRAGTNPGGVGHVWVKSRFIDKCPPYEIKHFKRVYDTEGNQIEVSCASGDPAGFSRQFIPAKVQDNLILMGNDPGYVQRLNNLPDEQRRMLLCGDWDVFQGQFFKKFRKSIHVINPLSYSPSHWHRYVSIDYGTTNPFCALWLMIDYDGNVFVYRELYRDGLNSTMQARAVKAAKGKDNIREYIADPSMWAKNQTDAQANMKSIQDYYSDEGITLTKANNDRVHGANVVREYLDWQGHEEAVTIRPRLYIYNTCVNLIRTLPALVHDNTRPEDVDTDGEDHAYDALRYGLVHIYKPRYSKMDYPNQSYDDHGKLSQPSRKRAANSRMV